MHHIRASCELRPGCSGLCPARFHNPPGMEPPWQDLPVHGRCFSASLRLSHRSSAAQGLLPPPGAPAPSCSWCSCPDLLLVLLLCSPSAAACPCYSSCPARCPRALSPELSPACMILGDASFSAPCIWVLDIHKVRVGPSSLSRSL